ncbi:MAG: CHAT domain-containing tetratricopeptide repeat protein [Ginsengibacter sp.]
MHTALSKIFRYSIIYILIFIGNRQYVLAQHSVHDSLRLFLMHFHEKTIDNDFKKAVEKVQAAYTVNTINDSLITKLIDLEYLLANVIEENHLMNYDPFNRKIVFSFAEKVVAVSKVLSRKNDSLQYASALSNLGIFYSHFPDLKKFSFFIEKAYEIRKRHLSEQDCDYAESLVCMAQVYWLKGDKEQALDFGRKALMLTQKEELRFQINRAKCLYILGQIYYGMYKYDTAAQYFEKELEVRKKILGEDNAHYALRLYLSGEMFHYLWQFDKGASLYQQAIDCTEKTLGKVNLQYAYCLEGLGGHNYSVAKYDTAIPFYKQSIAIKEQLFGKDYYGIALSLHNLATTYQQMGNYPDALFSFQRAIELSENGVKKGFIQQYTFIMNYLASLYRVMGQYSESLSLLQNSLAIIKKLSTEINPDYARALNTLATLYEDMYRYDSALYYYKRVLTIKHRLWGNTHPEYATSLDNLGRLYKKTGKYNIAVNLCRQGLDIRKNKFGDKSPAYAASLNNLGDLYMQIGKYDSASILLNESLNIRKQVLGDSHPDYVKSLNSLGILNMTSGKTADAAALFAEANSIQLKHIRRTYTSLSEQEKLNLINEEYYQFSYLPSLLYINPGMPNTILQQVYKTQVVLKGMVLDDQKEVLESMRQSRDSIELQQYDQWRFNKGLAGKQLLLPLSQRLPWFDSLQKVTDQMEQGLSRSSLKFRDQQKTQTITISDVTNKLAKSEAAIEFIKFPLYNKKQANSTIYAAIVLLPGDSAGKFIPLCEEKQLKCLLARSARGDIWAINKLYRKAIDVDRSKSAADSLYSLIWKPLEKYLAGVYTIYYAPAGLLQRIAFQALPYDSSQLLIDRYHLNQLLSTRSIVLPAPVNEKPAMINVWGNIQYDFQTNVTYPVAQKETKKDNKNNIDTTTASFNFYAFDTRATRGGAWPQLAGAKIELDSIKNVFINANISVNATGDTLATEEAFKAMDGNSPQVLHVATHGFFLPVKETKSASSTTGKSFSVQQNPMFRSGLVLAGGNYTWQNKPAMPGREDGILTSYEIAQMDLSNTNLVVLSACQTALGDLQGNEGVIGLQRAFKMAGVKQLMMSLWKIPDQQTTELMTLFYKNWLGGQSTAEALRSAQLIIKEKYPSPYYWAGFVLVE